MQELLLQWYDRAARDLPWRVKGGRGEPYRVWISEVMLQQTRVEAVIPYYARFLHALPDIPALAAVDTDMLYKLWEGLGYYSRARNLREAACICVSRYAGMLPDSRAALLELPGIGDYTAGAIASIAYGERVPAVDGNVLRVWARFTADARDILDVGVRREMRDAVAEIVPQNRPGDFNQAMMELGATLCGPNTAPRCEECPLRDSCRGYADGIAALLPTRAPKKPRRVEELTVILPYAQGRLGLRRRGESMVLAGQWEYPNVPGTLDEAGIVETLRTWELNPTKLTPLPPAKHLFTHIEWRMTAWRADVEKASPALTWASPDEIAASYALPSAFKAWRPQGGTVSG